MDQHKYLACDSIDRHKDSLHELSKKIWNFAEVGKREVKSSEALITFLKKNDFDITKNLKGLPTAFLAEFGEKEFGGCSRPNIAIICQFDATRGKGHINGNNLVAEVAVATALGLQEAIRAASAKIGKVTLIGCPNSAGGDIITLINRKLFRTFDLALGAIPGPRTEWCPVFLAAKTFKATFRDTEQDICGEELKPTKDKYLRCPLSGAVLSQTTAHVLQQHFAKDWKLSGAIPLGGRRPLEPIHETTALIKTVAPSDRELILMEKRVVPCFNSAATASGCGVDIQMGDKMYHSLMSSPSLCYLLQLNAYHCGLLATPLKPREILPPTGMANVSHLMPTLRPMFYIGSDHAIGTEEFKDACESMTAHFNAMAMAKALAMTALDMMHSKGPLDDAKKDVKDELARQKNVAFVPFPEKKSKTYMVPKQVPVDCNIGWSKH